MAKKPDPFAPVVATDGGSGSTTSIDATSGPDSSTLSSAGAASTK